MGECKEARPGLFSVLPSARTRSDWHKLEAHEASSGHQETCSCEDAGEAVESPCLEGFKSCLDMVMCDPAGAGAGTRDK